MQGDVKHRGAPAITGAEMIPVEPDPGNAGEGKNRTRSLSPGTSGASSLGTQGMKLVVNGKARVCRPDCTLSDLLKQMKVDSSHVATAVNDEVVPRTDRSKHKLRDGDHVEVMTFAGGG